MAKYLVERHLPGFKPDELAAAAARGKAITAEMTQAGTPVRYLRSTFVPGEDKCYCLFESDDAGAVREANERARLPFQRITEAMHLASEDLA